MFLRCPKCDAALEREEYEGVFIFSCPQGHGKWLRQNDLGEVVRRREARIPEKYFAEVAENAEKVQVSNVLSEADTKCPECGSLCDKINYAYSSGIIIDVCPQSHGVWLDAEELEKVQAFSEYWDKKAYEFLMKKGVPLDTWAKDDVAENKDKKHTGIFESFFVMLYDKFFG